MRTGVQRLYFVNAAGQEKGSYYDGKDAAKEEQVLDHIVIREFTEIDATKDD